MTQTQALAILKTGANVIMFTKNNPKQGFVNGTLGRVEEFDDESACPIVKTARLLLE